MKPQFSGSARKIISILIPAIVILLGLYSLFIATAHHFFGDQEAFLMLPVSAQYDTPITIKVVVRKHSNNAPIAGAAVSFQAVSLQQKTVPLFSGKTDLSGIVTTTFQLPSELQAPELKLIARIYSKYGRDTIEKALPLSYSSRTTLASDRSYYAPGDTLHVRTVTEESTTSKPLPGEYVELTLKDPRGTAIFNRKERTSHFGVCAFQCLLADRARKGRYTITAKSFNTEETKTVWVGDYTAPALKLKLSLSQRYFLMDEEIKGSAAVTSPAGEAIAQAPVSISLAVDTELSRFSLDRIKGTTDRNGQFAFSYRLGEQTKEALKNKKKTILSLVAEAQSSEGRKITLTRMVPLCDRAIIIRWLPDGNGFVPGISNGSYLITTYPDGTPAPAQLTLSSLKISRKLETDSWGLAPLPFDPSKDGNDILTVKAVDSKGNRSEKPFEISSLVSPHSFTLTTGRTILKAGDTVSAEIASLQKLGFIFVDLIHRRQIVLSRTVAIDNGRAGLQLQIPQGLHGALQLRATAISGDGTFEEESRLLYVIPAERLDIAMKPDRKLYRPGEKARLEVLCTGRDSLPRRSAFEMILKGEVNAVPAGAPMSIPLTTPQSLFSESFYQALTEEQSTESLGRLISNPAFQERARLAFKMLPEKNDGDGNINIYAEKLKANQQKRARYFFTLFLVFFRLVIAAILMSFLIILGLTLAHTYLKEFNEKRVLVFRNSEEVVSLMIFIVGFLILLLCPMMFALPISYFSGIPLLELRHHSFFQIFLALQIFLMFIYLLTLWRNVRVRPIRKMSTLKYTFFTLQWYVGAFIVLISLLFSRSVTNWDISQMIAINRPLILMALFTLTAMPFVLLYSTFSHLMKPKVSKFRKATFYFSTTVIVAVIISAAVLIQAQSGALEKEQSSPASQTGASTADKPNESKGKGSSSIAEDLENQMKSSEVFFYTPQCITDKKGEASIAFDVPFSQNPLIVLARGSTEKGESGSASIPLDVKCNFTVHAQLPPFMSIGDSISLPVRITNCNDRTERAALSILQGSGVTSPARKPLEFTLLPRESRTFLLPVTASKAGEQTLSICVQKGKDLTFRTGTVKVVPLTEEVVEAKSGRINAEEKVSLVPPSSQTGDLAAARLMVYPATLALLNECSRALSRAPVISFDDAEAAASADVQLLRYMKKGKLENRELEKDAQDRLSISYQRLLAFESEDGGFSRFGAGRCSPWMTARALLCLGEMSEVYAVDPSLLRKITGWLMSSQKSDGSWDKSPITTAWVLYALTRAGVPENGRISKAHDFIRRHIRKDADDSILALVVLTMQGKDAKRQDVEKVVQRLQSSAVITGSSAYWSSPVSILQKGEKSPSTSSRPLADKGADIRTTALCARALMVSGTSPELRDKALNFLLQSHDASGYWHSSVCTTEVLRTLTAGEATVVHKGLISLEINGRIAQNIVADSEKSDRAIEVALDIKKGSGSSELTFIPKDAPGASFTVLQSFIGKTPAEDARTNAPMITSTFPEGVIAQGQTVMNSIKLNNRSRRDFSNLVVEIPVPAAFELSKGTSEALKENSAVEEYMQKNGIIYLCIEELKKGGEISVNLAMKALYPGHITSLPARVYETQNLDVSGVSNRAAITIE